MYRKLFSFNEWLYLGMRENTYLVALVVLIAVMFAYGAKVWVLPWLHIHKWIAFCGDTATFFFTTAFVFVFLRPINQFIYFQF